jgi:hypothetical protein
MLVCTGPPEHVYYRWLEGLSAWSKFISGGGSLTLDSSRDLVGLDAAVVVPPKASAKTLGYSNQGDGGGGEYYYDAADSTSVSDGGAVRVDAAGRRWKLLFRVYNVRQWGAKGINEGDDTDAIDAAVQAATLAGGEVVIPAGTYPVLREITAVSAFKTLTIRGESSTERPVLRGIGQEVGNPSIIRVTNSACVRIADLIVDGESDTHAYTDGIYPVYVSGCYRAEFINVTVRNFKQTNQFMYTSGINSVRTRDYCEVRNCQIENLWSAGVGNGLLLQGNASPVQYSVSGCRFVGIRAAADGTIANAWGLVRAIYLVDSAKMCEIFNCWFEDVHNTSTDGVTLEWEDADGVVSTTSSYPQAIYVHDCYFRNIGKRFLKIMTPDVPMSEKCFTTCRNCVLESSYTGDDPNVMNGMHAIASFYGGNCEFSNNLVIGGRFLMVIESLFDVVRVVVRDNVIVPDPYEGNINGSYPQYFYSVGPFKHIYSGNYVRMNGKPFYISGETLIMNNIIDNGWNTDHFVLQTAVTANPPNTAPHTVMMGNYIRTTNQLSTGDKMQSMVVKGNHFVQATTVPISSATASGTTVTITCAVAHGFSAGDNISIAGAEQWQYNRDAVISNVTATTFDYTASSAPSVSPATGYMLCTKLKPIGFYVPDGERDLVVADNIFEGFYGAISMAVSRTDVYSIVFSGNLARASFSAFPRFLTPEYRKFAAIDLNEPYCPDGTGPGEVSWHHPTAVTVGAAGSAAVLPATPTGYISTRINGTVRKIPYYNT